MRIFDFPTVPVSKQLFHVPGAAAEGGYTAGAVRMLSPEPGGRSVLEMQIAMQVEEWNYPIASWLMSKGNGDVFRVRLAPTPQVLAARYLDTTWDDNILWSNKQPWIGDITANFATSALEGENTVSIDMGDYGDIVRAGHVIGRGDNAYIIDEVTFDTTTGHAQIVVKPPFRTNITAGMIARFRPFFLGTISNMSEVRATYDAVNVGHIQPGKIIFTEVIG